VSADPVTIQQFSHALQELSLSLEVCEEASAAGRLLNRQKFDAVIFDLQLGEQSGLILDKVHLSSSNRTAVTVICPIAIASLETIRTRPTKAEAEDVALISTCWPGTNTGGPLQRNLA